MSSSEAQSLRRDEAQERARQLEVVGYDVELDLACDDTTFASISTISFTSEGGPTFVDVKPSQLRAIRLNDRDLDVGLLHRGRFPLETVAGSNVLVVDAVMPFRNDGEGLHRSVDAADGRHYVYGMSFMDAAPTIFACFDQPDLKAPYTMHVRAPLDWTVIGNAPATNPEPGLWEIGPTQPLSTYFVTVVAGPYHLVRDEHDGIPLSLSCRASLAPHLDKDAVELFTLTKQCFDEFHRLFGIRYPFGNYHQAFVPEFNAGAMENPGCVTFRDQYVFDTRVTRGMRVLRATTVAHEMAHQWFGNITTPLWWDDLWLNESFAEYLGNRVTAEATEYQDAWTNVAWSRRQWGLLADQRPSTHPVAGNGAVDAVAALQDFDGISYVKGSSILRQLCTALGDDVFFGGTIDHFNRHRFGNATMHDLLSSWEGAGAGDLSAVVAQWMRTAGPDTFHLDREQGVLVRTAPELHPADRAHTFEISSLAGGECVTVPVQVSGPRTPVVNVGDVVVLDPREQSWGVYVPDESTVRGLARELPLVTDPMLRAAIWNNVKSGYAVAAVDPDLVVDLLEAALPIEDTEDTERHTLPWVLDDVLPAASADSTPRVHAAALALVDSTPPASELQLSAFRTCVRTASDPDLVRGWLAQPPDGIEVDLDVRWRLLTRLAVLGGTTRAELDSQLDENPTTQARVEHTGAVASLPTPEAKAWAWERFTGAAAATNYEIEIAGHGLWRGGSALTAPYVERYVVDLPATSTVRSGWVLAVAAEAFFPESSTRQRSSSFDPC